ncbi:hypothetical protein ElyMa_002429800 [Elysia marginata]|uniref:Uncharacterized protein n=1 Tax=Elysia marginata TaxID=1093978 RepID=A0AAV4GIX3_9GAST|nr:hypothetical protein ElyMa_002429800 [Elysia marginata]
MPQTEQTTAECSLQTGTLHFEQNTEVFLSNLPGQRAHLGLLEARGMAEALSGWADSGRSAANGSCPRRRSMAHVNCFGSLGVFRRLSITGIIRSLEMLSWNSRRLSVFRELISRVHNRFSNGSDIKDVIEHDHWPSFCLSL